MKPFWRIINPFSHYQKCQVSPPPLTSPPTSPVQVESIATCPGLSGPGAAQHEVPGCSPATPHRGVRGGDSGLKRQTGVDAEGTHGPAPLHQEHPAPTPRHCGVAALGTFTRHPKSFSPSTWLPSPAATALTREETTLGRAGVSSGYYEGKCEQQSRRQDLTLNSWRVGAV